MWQPLAIKADVYVIVHDNYMYFLESLTNGSICKLVSLFFMKRETSLQIVK